VARLSDRLPENVAGEFFVDQACIDCDTCRILAPLTFGWTDSGKSFVERQPDSAAERHRALMALVSCPTAAIGTEHKLRVDAAVASLPERIDGGVYYCGYASESSFGASSYLIVRPSGNVMIDSPRASKPLIKRVEALGGVRLLFLTHRDDVADHERWVRAFGCERVMHKRDVSHETRNVERIVDGESPTRLDHDLVVIPVPGHTRGSAALLHDRYLFTGDHLWGTPDGSELSVSRSVCWYSWAAQTRSMSRLLDFDFEWVLPGHGFRYQAPSSTAMKAELQRVVERMRANR